MKLLALHLQDRMLELYKRNFLVFSLVQSKAYCCHGFKFRPLGGIYWSWLELDHRRQNWSFSIDPCLMQCTTRCPTFPPNTSSPPPLVHLFFFLVHFSYPSFSSPPTPLLFFCSSPHFIVNWYITFSVPTVCWQIMCQYIGIY